ncbi:RHS repeat domain-containing protein [Bordetella bronchialis]|uniref:RHS repeat domain-containing protein n=1 Tax=Bordetella bronchialis TaxID=463025 RepID=UPI003D0538FA
MSNAPSFVSQAGNFSSAVSGQVDPRTGLYGTNITLGKIIGNQGIGPAWPVTLQYSPMTIIQGNQGTDLNLGDGITLCMSMYDTQNQMLIMSTGESYPVDESAGTPDGDGGVIIPLVQSKLQSVTFKRYDSCNIPWKGGAAITSCYKVIQKSGMVEILQGGNMGNPTKLPLLSITPSGQALAFQWQYQGSTCWLAAVLDDTGATLMKASQDMTVFTFYPDTPESYQAELIYQAASKLTQVKIRKSDTADPLLSWTLNYASYSSDPKWAGWVTGLDLPGGGSESVTYMTTHSFPPSAGLPDLPAVRSHTQTPGAGQPAITTTYTYSSQQSGTDMDGHNFVAGATDMASWSTNRDNLYDYSSAYDYGSVETCVDRVTTRVYNKFHLQTVEKVTQGSGTDQKTIVTQTAYYADESAAYQDLQYAFFQCPKTKTTTWVNGSDPDSDPHIAETTSYGDDSNPGWDNWGNPLRMTAPDGLFTQWSYYDGSTDTYDTQDTSKLLCPADPNGFTRYAQWMKIDPSGVTGDYIESGAPAQQTNFTYASVTPAAISSTTPYVNGLVLQNYSSHTSGSTLIAEVTHAYDTGGQLNAGRVTQQVATHYPDGKTGTSSASYKSTQSFTYTAGTFSYPAPSDTDSYAVLTTTHTLKADDPDVKAEQANGHPAGYLQVQGTVTTSNYSGRKLQETDTVGNATQYQYDFLGRVTSRSLNALSTDGATNTFTYQYAIAGSLLGDSATYPFQVSQTDPNNNSACYTMDGLHRRIRHDINAPDVPNGVSTWWKTETRSYDNMGRLSTHTVLDYEVDDEGNQQGDPYTLVATTLYDNWGQAKQVSYTDNTADLTVYDPVGKTISHTRCGMTDGQTVTLRTAWYVTTYDYNANRKPIKMERRQSAATPDAATPYSQRTRTYNGLYWVMSDTDEMNRKTTYAQDAWGRTTVTTLPDATYTTSNQIKTPATVVTRGYSRKSPAAWVSSITVNGWLTGQGTAQQGTCTVGTRNFNSLGRITSKTVGGCTWTYHYPYDSTAFDGYPQPDSAVSPDNQTYQYEYDYEHDAALLKLTVAQYTQQFEYEPVTGIMTSAQQDLQQQASTQTSLLSFQPFPSGRLQGETIDYPQPDAPQAQQADAFERTTSYWYTIGGAMSKYVHVDGATTVVQRDAQGRISSVADDDVTVTPQYDDAGRLTGWQSKDETNNDYVLTTTLTLDDFGRETQRTIQDVNNLWTITQDPSYWQKNDLLGQRVTELNSSTRSEVYTYDARNRLKQWSCGVTGTDLPAPCDRYGNTMRTQVFTFDALNNVTTVVSQLSNASSTGVNTTTFSFDYSTDPCRLLTGTNSKPEMGYTASFTVQYDAAGRITNDGQGTTLSYDAMGRVSTAASELTGLNGTYTYDAFNRQGVTTSSDTDNAVNYFYYRSNELVNLIQGSGNNIRLYRSLSGAPAAQYNSAGDQAGAWMLGADQLGSVLNSSNGQPSDVEQRAYSPYGEESLK